MSGRPIRRNGNRAFYEYREQHGFDVDSIKDNMDDQNEEIDGEWFGDGQWEVEDELEDVEEEDWEIWLDWFSG